MLRSVFAFNSSKWVKISGGCAAAWLAIAPLPAHASETVSFWFGPIQRSVAVSDLRQYAEQGEASADLAGLLAFIKPKTREEIKQVLNYKLPLDLVTMSRLAYSEPGTKILEKFSTAFIRKDDAGVTALRGGLVLAAGSQDGLSVMTFMENYPNQELNLSIPKFLKVLETTKDLPTLLRGR